MVVCHYLRERKEHIYTYVPYANTFWKDTQETITVAASREGICTAGDSCGREDFSLLYFLCVRAFWIFTMCMIYLFKNIQMVKKA